MTKGRTTVAARVAVAGVMLGLAVACSVDVDIANKACPCGGGYVCDEPRQVCVLPQDLALQPQVPPACDPCTCAVDADCKDPTRAHCSPNKVCVECGKSPDTCAVGYCNDLFQCTVGCKDEGDCQKISPGTHCLLTQHQCVECVAPMFPCKDAGKNCSPSGVCAESCSATKPCAAGKACCAGLCIDSKTDVLNCGACDFPCSTKNGTPACAAGACKWSCASGFAHCGGANTGCEVNTRTDVAHCGSCTNSCSNLHANGVTCNAGACTYTTCQPGYGDCDNQKANGCECTCGTKGDRCCPQGNPCPTGVCTGAGKCSG